MESKEVYYGASKILDMLIGYELKKGKEYPFHKGAENITFQWANILIPRNDIEKIIWKTVKNEPLDGLKRSIEMVVQIPFCVSEEQFGVIHINVSLDFRYDKEYKYGDVTKSLPETCFFIHDNALKMNDFYLLSSEYASEFLSYYVFNSQYGVGSMRISSAPVEKLRVREEVKNGSSTVSE